MARDSGKAERGTSPAGIGGAHGRKLENERMRRQRAQELLGSLVLYEGREPAVGAAIVISELQLLRTGITEGRKQGRRNFVRTRHLRRLVSLDFYELVPSAETLDAIVEGARPEDVLEKLHFPFVDGIDINLPEPHHGRQGFNLYDPEEQAELMISGLVIGRPKIRGLTLTMHRGFNSEVDKPNPSRGPSGHGPGIDFS